MRYIVMVSLLAALLATVAYSDEHPLSEQDARRLLEACEAEPETCMELGNSVWSRDRDHALKLFGTGCLDDHGDSCFLAGHIMDGRGDDQEDVLLFYLWSCDDNEDFSGEGCTRAGKILRDHGELSDAKALFTLACEVGIVKADHTAYSLVACYHLGLMELEEGNKRKAKQLFEGACRQDGSDDLRDACEQAEAL